MVPEDVKRCWNYDNENMATPIDVKMLGSYLSLSNYNQSETEFLIDGFTHGFTIGYQGPQNRTSQANNIPFTPWVGSSTEMWNKIMAEVEQKRVDGPFSQVPFNSYIQSPIGLVPKKGNKTRLIFHLSKDFSDDEPDQSLNYFTPKEICTTKYNDLDNAVNNCLRISGVARRPLVMAKTDLSSAFRMLPIKRQHWRWLVFKARDPESGEYYYFYDKCLPFGASISCCHYQRFSNALKHIAEYLTGKTLSITNYLDDFLFIEVTERRCNALVRSFLRLCNSIQVPVAQEKTEWASRSVVFLGVLLDGWNLILSIPEEKRLKALGMLQSFSDGKKVKVKELQELTGYLNFLSKAIFPGQAFTRRMYSKFSNVLSKGSQVKSYHHIRIDKEFRFDCEVWRIFLEMDKCTLVCRPMVDLNTVVQASTIGFFTDASGNYSLGFGGAYDNQWFYGGWDSEFMEFAKPSIAFMELYALTAGVLIWSDKLQNKRIVVHCDNKSVVQMVNNTTSSCKNCMYLIRLIVLSGLTHNRRLFATYVSSEDNAIADSLSRLDFKCFWKLAPSTMSKHQMALPKEIWPVSKIWQY